MSLRLHYWLLLSKLSWTAATDNVGVVTYEIYNGLQKIGETPLLTFNATKLNEGVINTLIVVAVDAAGNKSPNEFTIVETLSAPANVIIYYKLEGGFAKPHLSYQLGNGQPIAAPGTTLIASTEFKGYASINVPLVNEKTLIGKFNNGETDPSKWDSNDTKGYVFTKGTYTFVAGLNGKPGQIITGTPDVTAPGAPLGLKLVDKSNEFIKISWTAPNDKDVTEYLVYRDEVNIAAVKETMYNDMKVEKDKTYNYTVFARDAMSNTSVASAGLKVTLNDSIFTMVDRKKPTMTTAFVDGEKLETLLTNSNYNLELLEEKAEVREIQVKIPAESLYNAFNKNRNALLTIDTKFGAVRLPLQVISYPVVAGKLATLVKNMMINISVKRTDDAVNKELESLLLQQGSTLIGDSIEYKIMAENTNNAAASNVIEDFPMSNTGSTTNYHYVTRFIKLPKEVSNNITSVMTYDPSTKKTQFVPALFESRLRPSGVRPPS